FHPSVLLDRDLLDEHGLRYDPAYLESEDYELWSRVLAAAEGANLPEPLVLYRRHAGQASERRRDLQRSFQLRVALREIARFAPGGGGLVAGPRRGPGSRCRRLRRAGPVPQPGSRPARGAPRARPDRALRRRERRATHVAGRAASSPRRPARGARARAPPDP